MTLATQVRKITNSKPFYALAGVGDYAAVELPKKARGYAGAAVAKANAFYEDLAVRGRRVVSRVTHEAANELEDFAESAKKTVAAELRRAGNAQPAPSESAITAKAEAEKASARATKTRPRK